MKKKIFNATIGGYYVVSIVLGIVMALTVSMMACDLWYFAFERQIAMERTLEEQYNRYGDLTAAEEAIWEKVDLRSDNLANLLPYVPLSGVSDELYAVGATSYELYDGKNYIPFVLVVSAILTVVLSVLIMEGKSANKVWRQKMLQAVAIAATIVLLVLSYQCADWRTDGKWRMASTLNSNLYGNVSPLMVVLPVVLLAIPLIVLKKTRVRTERVVISSNPLGGVSPGTKLVAEIERTE